MTNKEKRIIQIFFPQSRKFGLKLIPYSTPGFLSPHFSYYSLQPQPQGPTCCLVVLGVCFFHQLRYSHRKIYSFKVHNSVVSSVFTKLCNHHHYLIPEYVHHPRRKPHTHQQSLPILLSPQPLATTAVLFVTMDLPILDVHNGIIDYVAFCVWLFSYSMFSSFIHVVA